MRIKNKMMKLSFLKKVFALVLVISLVTPYALSKVGAVAGDANDFLTGQEPPQSKVNAQDFFTVPGVSNSYFHKDYSNVIVINSNSANQKGGIWSNEKVSLNSAFSYETHLYVGASQGRNMGSASGILGADGITFTMHNDPLGPQALGAFGHALGAYYRSGSSSGIRNAISFEFDSYPQTYDTDTGDLKQTNEYKHTAFVKPTDPVGYAKHFDLKLIAAYDDENGNILSRWVPFDAVWTPNEDGSGVLTITLNGVSSSYTINDYKTYFGGDSVYFGYTGGTGTAFEMHAISIGKMPTSYYANFDLNADDVVSPPIDSQILEANELVSRVSDPVRDGYTFSGWNTLSDGTGLVWDFDTMVMADHDMTLYAMWTPIEYIVNFELNGADSNAIANQSVAYKSLIQKVETPTKTGYNFLGWNELVDGSGSMWNFDTMTMPKANKTLYAVWDINTYTANFDTVGGNETIVSQTKAYDSLLDTVSVPTKAGYTFKEWNTVQDGSGNTWSFETMKMPANDITLYAVWDINTYTANFDTVGGNETIVSQTKAYDSLLDTVNVPTKEGYTFKGWNAASDGQGTAWDFTTMKMPANDITLYAQWEINTYELSFEANEGKGTMSKQTFQYNQEQALLKNTFTREGYTFIGWSTSKTGSVEYKDTTNYTFKDTADTVLYAVWKKDDVKPNVTPSKPAEKKEAPATGDTTNTTMMFSLLLISGVLMIGLRRRKEK